MDIKGLRYFIAAAERLNFTTAAKECYITQTAMSLHIGKMETELGFMLFDRSNRVVGLTSAGEDFLQKARLIVQGYDNAVQHSASIAAGVRGIINVTFPSCMEGFAYMERFKAFQSEYPDIEINLNVESPDKLIGLLKNRQSDVIFGALYEMLQDPDCNVIELREDEAVLICGSDHPFAKMDHVTADMLNQEIFFMSAPKSLPLTYKKFRSKWLAAGFEPKDVHPVRNLDEILMMIDLGRGVALLPAFISDNVNPLTTGVVRVPCEYEGEAPTMRVALSYMKDNQNPTLEYFLKYFRDID
ncbi:MAG: LysR family transcriptional regulator [Clostridiales Family XIII bacterium]|nr:LysR family transcriptional regulator [Clostridiales Family XIII bacterium]